jgi:hypothetical protein
MLAAPPVLRTLLDIEPISRHSVAVTAAAAARTLVMHAQLDPTERAFALDDGTDRLLCLIA